MPNYLKFFHNFLNIILFFNSFCNYFKKSKNKKIFINILKYSYIFPMKTLEKFDEKKVYSKCIGAYKSGNFIS